MGNGTSIGRVRGLGAAHHGPHHWLVQRFTAIGNVVLMSWLLVSLIMLGDYGHANVVKWLSQPISATAMILLVISLFWHARLGLQVVIEDYVRGELARMGAILAVKGLCALLWLSATLAVLRIAV